MRSPNVKTLCNFEPQFWPEFITSRDAESTCFKGSRMSCREIIFGIFWPNFGRKRSHHVMDASCRFRFSPKIVVRKEQVVFSGEGRRVPKLLESNPKVAPVQVWVALEQDTFLGLSGPRPKTLLAPSLIDFQGKNRNSALVPGNRNPKTRLSSAKAPAQATPQTEEAEKEEREAAEKLGVVSPHLLSEKSSCP